MVVPAYFLFSRADVSSPPDPLVDELEPLGAEVLEPLLAAELEPLDAEELVLLLAEVLDPLDADVLELLLAEELALLLADELVPPPLAELPLGLLLALPPLLPQAVARSASAATEETSIVGRRR